MQMDQTIDKRDTGAHLFVHEGLTGRYPFLSQTRATAFARHSFARSPLYLCIVYKPEAAAKLGV